MVATGQLAGGQVDDNGMKWDYATLVRECRHMAGLIAATGIGYGVGAVIGEEFAAAAEVQVITMSTGDELYDLFPAALLRQYGFDLSRDIHARIIGAAQASSGDAIFKLDVKGIADGVTIGDARVSPDAAITYDAVSVLAAGSFATAWKALGVPNILTDDLLIGLAIELDDEGSTALNVAPIAVELRGTRTWCTGPDGERQVT